MARQVFRNITPKSRLGEKDVREKPYVVWREVLHGVIIVSFHFLQELPLQEAILEYLNILVRVPGMVT